jgi:hypothetical protein
MAENKAVKKPTSVTSAKKAKPAAGKPAAKKPAAAPQKKAAAAKPLAPAVRRGEIPLLDVPASARARAVIGPMARTCPLVLDGEVDASDFSEKDCLTCGEFDCKFCESQNGSGGLRSRLFAGSEDGEDEGEDGWDLDFAEGEETVGGEEADGEGEEDL